MGFLKITAAFGLCLVALTGLATAELAPSISLAEAHAALPECAVSSVSEFLYRGKRLTLPCCQIDCLRNAVNQSTCGANDLACLCPSNALNIDGAACVWGSCSRKEAFREIDVAAMQHCLRR